jgi:hypothetical protein
MQCRGRPTDFVLYCFQEFVEAGAEVHRRSFSARRIGQVSVCCTHVGLEICFTPPMQIQARGVANSERRQSADESLARISVNMMMVNTWAHMRDSLSIGITLQCKLP